jgi:hypothetical protein
MLLDGMRIISVQVSSLLIDPQGHRKELASVLVGVIASVIRFWCEIGIALGLQKEDAK